MAELISPIIYKKIDLSIFPNLNETNHQIFFDKDTNRLLLIDKDNSKVYVLSRDGKKLLLEIPLNFSLKTKIHKVTIDKTMRYMMILEEINSKHGLLIINIQKRSTLTGFVSDFDNLLGFFFINEQIFNTHNIDNELEVKFVLVFVDKICIYRILMKKEEKIEFIKNVNVTQHKKFTKFNYNQKYMVLCIQKEYIVYNASKLGFVFFNLSNQKFYQKTSSLKIILDKNTLKQLPKNLKDKAGHRFIHQDKTAHSHLLLNTKDDYRISHFFLENIYNKLYFLWLSYQDSQIHLYNVENLEKIQKEIIINFDGNVSTLQFLDNLILIHNFELTRTTIIDIRKDTKNDKKIFAPYPMTNSQYLELNEKKNENLLKINFIYEIVEEFDFKLKISSEYNKIENFSMTDPKNTEIYRKNCQINGKMIEVYETNETNDKKNSENKTYYYIYFEPKIYYEQKQKLLNMLTLIRRKNGKLIILDNLSKNIEHYSKRKRGRYNFKYQEIRVYELVKCLSTLCDLIIKATNVAVEMGKVKLKMINHQNPNSNGANYTELVKPYDTLYPKKKNLITQDNIYYGIFSPLYAVANVNPEIIIFFFVQLHSNLSLHQIHFPIGYYSTLLKFLQKISNFSKFAHIFQNYSLGTYSYIANFLITNIAFEKSNKFSPQEKKIAYQQGMDMYKRLHNYNEICFTLLNQNKISEALMNIKKYKINIKLFDKSYKAKIIQYCKSVNFWK